MAGPADDDTNGTPRALGLPSASREGRAATGGEPARRPSLRPKSLIGTTISDRYRIEKLLGEGGMGTVYQAEHTLMRKRMAIKVLHPEMTRLPEVVQRFEREAMAAAHIDHPNVVAATDFGKLEDGSFFLALEFVEGKSLREIIAEGPLDLGRALHIARQIAAALQRAHALKIVHRDLKPENVMLVERDGDADFVKVLDFGIAKVQIGELTNDAPAGAGQEVLTQAGMVYGTPEYMAPEQALGQAVDSRADLYALGIILYEMLTGLRPFDAESKVALLGMQVTAPVPPMSSKAPDASVPPEVEALAGRLLAKEASERLGDAKELIEGITAITLQLAAAGTIDARFAPPASGLATNPSMISGISPAPPEPARAIGAPDDSREKHEGKLPPRLAKLEQLVGGRQWILAAGAGAVAILSLTLTIAIVTRGRARADEQDAEVVIELDGATTPEAPIDEKVKDAIAMIDRGDYGSGIKALEDLGPAIEGREDAHRALLKAYSSTDRPTQAMREARLLLKANPSLDVAKDVNLRVEVRDTALKEGGKDKAVADDAFALLEGPMGPTGWDDLYDVAYGSSGAQYPKAAARAKQSLGKGDRSKMSPALAVTVDLLSAGNNCAAIKALLERAAEKGDGRTLAHLRALVPPRVVGHWRKLDLLGCIHDRDRTLDKSIASLEDRLKKK